MQGMHALDVGEVSQVCAWILTLGACKGHLLLVRKPIPNPEIANIYYFAFCSCCSVVDFLATHLIKSNKAILSKLLRQQN